MLSFHDFCSLPLQRPLSTVHLVVWVSSACHVSRHGQTTITCDAERLTNRTTDINLVHCDNDDGFNSINFISHGLALHCTGGVIVRSRQGVRSLLHNSHKSLIRSQTNEQLWRTIPSGLLVQCSTQLTNRKLLNGKVFSWHEKQSLLHLTFVNDKQSNHKKRYR